MVLLWFAWNTKETNTTLSISLSSSSSSPLNPSRPYIQPPQLHRRPPHHTTTTIWIPIISSSRSTTTHALTLSFWPRLQVVFVCGRLPRRAPAESGDHLAGIFSGHPFSLHHLVDRVSPDTTVQTPHPQSLPTCHHAPPQPTPPPPSVTTTTVNLPSTGKTHPAAPFLYFLFIFKNPSFGFNLNPIFVLKLL